MSWLLKIKSLGYLKSLVVVASVARYWNIKQPKCLKNCPKEHWSAFAKKYSFFKIGLKVTNDLAYFLVDNWLLKTFNNRQIWSPWNPVKSSIVPSLPVWPDKNRQMSAKVAQKWFHQKNYRFWYLYKNCLRMWENWAN